MRSKTRDYDAELRDLLRSVDDKLVELCPLESSGVRLPQGPFIAELRWVDSTTAETVRRHAAAPEDSK